MVNIKDICNDNSVPKKAYIIKYYHTGFVKELLHFLYPDGKKIISANSAGEAIDKFKKEYKDLEVYDIKGVN